MRVSAIPSAPSVSKSIIANCNNRHSGIPSGVALIQSGDTWPGLT